VVVVEWAVSGTRSAVSQEVSWVLLLAPPGVASIGLHSFMATICVKSFDLARLPVVMVVDGQVERGSPYVLTTFAGRRK